MTSQHVSPGVIGVGLKQLPPSHSRAHQVRGPHLSGNDLFIHGNGARLWIDVFEDVLMGHQLPVPQMLSRLPIQSPQDAGFTQGVNDLSLNSANLHVGQLYPELRTPRGSNILMVFALGE